MKRMEYNLKRFKQHIYIRNIDKTNFMNAENNYSQRVEDKKNTGKKQRFQWSNIDFGP